MSWWRRRKDRKAAEVAASEARRAEMRAEWEAKDAETRGRIIYKMTTALLAGDPDWGEPVMRMHVGLAQRMMNAAIAKAIQHIQGGRK